MDIVNLMDQALGFDWGCIAYFWRLVNECSNIFTFTFFLKKKTSKSLDSEPEFWTFQSNLT